MAVASLATSQGKRLIIKTASLLPRLLSFEVGSKYPSHHADGKVLTNDEVLLVEGYVKSLRRWHEDFRVGSRKEKLITPPHASFSKSPERLNSMTAPKV